MLSNFPLFNRKSLLLVACSALVFSLTPPAKGQNVQSPNDFKQQSKPVGTEQDRAALMSAGSDTQVVCGSLPPTGWITISINGICGQSGSTKFIGRTIKKIDGAAANTSLDICGDVPPAGWITTAIRNQSCAQTGSTSYIGRTIRRIQGVPIGTTLDICGDVPPAGWVTIATKSGHCAQVGSTSYIGRTIRKLSTTAGLSQPLRRYTVNAFAVNVEPPAVCVGYPDDALR